MASGPRRSTAFRAQLKEFELPNVEFTGEKLQGGEGSYGYVEIAGVSGTRCAAKVIHEVFKELYQAGSKGKSPVEYFRRECSLMSRLRHPHIVQFIGICYPPGSEIPALVMELLMTSLHDYLESKTKKDEIIPMAIKRDVLLDVSKGLVYLHDMNVVHRDLTAKNILLSDSLTAKIADLGMARLVNIGAGRQANAMTLGPGNINYMPPEARDGPDQYTAYYGKPIDCFSMGNIVLFTLNQIFPEVMSSTYFDKVSQQLKARNEVERRLSSFDALSEKIQQDHPFIRLAMACLEANPSTRPTAAVIKERIQSVSMAEYRNWNQAKDELICRILELESALSKLQQENASGSTGSSHTDSDAVTEDPLYMNVSHPRILSYDGEDHTYINVPKSPGAEAESQRPPEQTNTLLRHIPNRQFMSLPVSVNSSALSYDRPPLALPQERSGNIDHDYQNYFGDEEQLDYMNLPSTPEALEAPVQPQGPLSLPGTADTFPRIRGRPPRALPRQRRKRSSSADSPMAQMSDESLRKTSGRHRARTHALSTSEYPKGSPILERRPMKHRGSSDPKRSSDSKYYYM